MFIVINEIWMRNSSLHRTGRNERATNAIQHVKYPSANPHYMYSGKPISLFPILIHPLPPDWVPHPRLSNQLHEDP